jgi:hypothetical protein
MSHLFYSFPPVEDTTASLFLTTSSLFHPFASYGPPLIIIESGLRPEIVPRLKVALTMKLSRFAVSVASLWSANAKYESFPLAKSGLAAESKLGVSLLSKARLLEENGNNENQNVDTTWVSGYSLKFLGCHHIRQVCSTFS